MGSAFHSGSSVIAEVEVSRSFYLGAPNFPSSLLFHKNSSTRVCTTVYITVMLSGTPRLHTTLVYCFHIGTCGLRLMPMHTYKTS